MKSRHTVIAVSAVIIILVLGSMLVSVVVAIQLPPELQNFVVRLLVVMLVLFMALLVVRYLSLLWLGYLHHISLGMRDPDKEGFAPPISILVPAYNEGLTIKASIRSLLKQNYPRFEVLVIDDGSTDETYQKASQYEGQHGRATVRVVSKTNTGKAGALNTGISLARYPYVLCMDGDSRLDPDTLRHGIAYFTHPEVAAVAGNVKVVNRTNLWTRLQALEYIQGLNMARRAQGFVRAVNIIPGPIGIFRRDVLLRLGGYDTDTFAEDADLTLKILADGWRIEYEPRAIAFTEAPEALLSLIKQRYRWTRGILQAVRKRRSVLIEPSSFATWLSVAMMVFESVIWPVMNVLGSLFFVTVAVAYGASAFLVAWWLLLTVLDIVAAIHTVAMEGEDLGLVPYAVVYRFFFILLVDVSKLFATLEELLNVEMTWGKLERLGRI